MADQAAHGEKARQAAEEKTEEAEMINTEGEARADITKMKVEDEFDIDEI
jgi:hypothetical protein